jgi:hypothetical protein
MDDGLRVHPLGSIEEISGNCRKNRICCLAARARHRLRALVWWRVILRWATPAPTMPEAAGDVKVNHCERRVRDRS